MSYSKKYMLAYCVDNQKVAQDIDRKLSRAGFQFTHVVGMDSLTTESINQRLMAQAHPIVLLVSDNFLKSEGCMYQSLAFLQKFSANQQLMPVVIDGEYSRGESGRIELVPTEFDRVSQIIKYMNYWQEKYLELRKQKRHVAPEDEPALNQRLQTIRTISSEAGEFLRFLRSGMYYIYPQFIANDFIQFFLFADVKDQHFAYQQIAAADKMETEQQMVEPAATDLEPEASAASLVDIIHASTPDILVENEKTETPVPQVEALTQSMSNGQNGVSKVNDLAIEPVIEEVPEIDIAAIPGMELLTENESKEVSEQIATNAIESSELPETLEEPPSILQEIITEETPSDTTSPIEEKVEGLIDANGEFETDLEELTELTEVEAPEENEEHHQEDALIDEILREQKMGVNQDLTWGEQKETPAKSFVEETLGESQELAQVETALKEDVKPVEEKESESAETEIVSRALETTSTVETEQIPIEEELQEEIVESNLEEEVLDQSMPHTLSLEEVVQQANVLFRAGSVEGGLSIYQQALEDKPEDTSLRYLYAFALAKYSHDFKRASQELEVLLGYDPLHEDAYFLLAELAELHQDHLLAKNYYEKVEAINPKYPNIYHRLGIITLNHFDHKKKAAVNYFKKAIKQNKNNADAHYRLGILLNEYLGKHWKAIKHFKQTLKIKPTHPFANYDLAVLNHRLGDRPLANSYYQKAIEINPELKTPKNDEAFRYELLENVEETGLPHFKETDEDPELTALKKDLDRLEAKMAALNQPNTETVVLESARPISESELDALLTTTELEETEEVQELVETPNSVETADEIIPFFKTDELAEEIQEIVESSNGQTHIQSVEEVMPLFDIQEAPEEIIEPSKEQDSIEKTIEAIPIIHIQEEREEPFMEDTLESVFEEVVMPEASPKEIIIVEDAPQEIEVIIDAEPESISETETLEPEKDLAPVVFITGATSGIGKATAELFAQNGYRVVITGRREERLKILKAGLEARYESDIEILPFDVRNHEAVKTALESLPDDWKQVDILINNAGLARGKSPIHEGDLDHWETMIDTNVKGLLYMTRAIAPHMVARRHGHIINIASTAGKEVYPGGNVYCATKFAVDALTKAMRVDLYKHNIRVSQVAPAMVEETEFAVVRFDGDQERAKIYEDFQPLKAKDVAETIYFIATRPSYVNIQDVVMMGTQQANSIFVDRSGRGDRVGEEEE